MRNAGPEEAQAEIKTAGRNISNHRYADDTTLMAESEEELGLCFIAKLLIFLYCFSCAPPFPQFPYNY